MNNKKNSFHVWYIFCIGMLLYFVSFTSTLFPKECHEKKNEIKRRSILRGEILKNQMNLNIPRGIESTGRKTLQRVTNISSRTDLNSTGSISGTVLDGASNPISNAEVYLYDSGGFYIKRVHTDNNGNYEIQGLAAGNYKVWFFPYELNYHAVEFLGHPTNHNYKYEWYNNKERFSNANFVKVSAGVTTTGIDAVMIDGEGGIISGQIKNSSGSGIEGCFAYTNKDVWNFIDMHSSDIYNNTGADGKYQIKGLPSGNYKVWFIARYSDSFYRNRYYNNVLDFENASLVSVTAGSITPGIDGTLHKGGNITGRVTDSSGNGLEGVLVRLHDAVTNKYMFVGDSKRTDINGYYTLKANPGKWKVIFQTCFIDSGSYIVEFYNDRVLVDNADIITVSAESTFSNINAVLTSGGGNISGYIRNKNFQAIYGANVIVYNTQYKTWISFAYTDKTGYFKVKGLSPGSYKLFFYYYNIYASEWYSDKTSFESAKKVSVSNGGNTQIQVILGGNDPDNSPQLSLNRTDINFGYSIGTSLPDSQNFTISNSGGETLNWTATADAPWINHYPASGIGDSMVAVNIAPSGLTPGHYTGIINISDVYATNSPQTINLTLDVFNITSTSPPFGEFSTPIDGSTVSSSIPVTGWALDDIGVESVKIYRGEIGNLVYIGDALFVEGARPDVEAAYPGYPMNYKAGWGYMMLTNFLPNGGNGTFKIHAIATDTEGHEVTLGTKMIICDNANAVKPFGAIDTPTQGGNATGSNFINWGWVLTPQPNSIPTDGSTINVWVDGINLGHPTYNINRSDIAQLFPGYNNTDGAAGYFSLDTTVHTNGVHTIQWTATDSGGNTDGIGSRYFTIQNTSSSRAQGANTQVIGFDLPQVSKLSINFLEPIKAKRGYSKHLESRIITTNDKGIARVNMNELEYLELQLAGKESDVTGYVVAGDQLRPLPVGCSIKNCIFYWIPGPGFIGDYRLMFVVKDQYGVLSKREVVVRIGPRFIVKE